MGRSRKQGLDYSAWRVDIFENDTKIDALLDAQGWVGWSIYFYLCQKAYSSDGYFYRWTYDNAATTARRMGGGIGSETVKQTVAVCLRIGLFDKRLFDLGGVLTSKGIQRNYGSVIENRRRKEVKMEYWLLDPEETRSYGITPEKNDPQDVAGEVYPFLGNLQDANGDLSGANGDLSDANGGFAPYKVKESRVKESKGKESIKRTPEEPPPPGPDSTFRSYSEHEKKEVDGLIEARRFPPKLEYALKDWVKYKAELGAPYHSSGANALAVMIAGRLEDLGEKAVCEAIVTSMGQGWKSIVFDKDGARGGKAGSGKSAGGYDWEAIRRSLDD